MFYCMNLTIISVIEREKKTVKHFIFVSKIYNRYMFIYLSQAIKTKTQLLLIINRNIVVAN